MPEKLLEQRIAELNASSSAPLAVSDDKEKRTYSIEEIQQILDISRSTAYLLIKRQLFKSVKVGKQIRISKRALTSGWTLFSCQRYKSGKTARIVPLRVLHFPTKLYPWQTPWVQLAGDEYGPAQSKVAKSMNRRFLT